MAAVVYIDPGNSATNVAAGAGYGYSLASVIVAANLMAMLVQYLVGLEIWPGVGLRVLEREPFGGPLWVETGGQRRAMGTSLTHLVHGLVQP